MKVAFISGCIEYSICLANALCNECEVDFIYHGAYANQRDASILDLLDSRIKKIEVNAYRLRDPRNFLSHRRLAQKLRSYDIIHVQQGNVWLSLNRYLFRNVPMVCTVHDPTQHPGLRLFNRTYQNFVQHWIAAQSSTYIVHGEKMKADLAANFSINRDIITDIPHGEFSFYKRLRSDRSKRKAYNAVKRILFFGEVRKNKGLEYLIQAEPLISKRFNNYTICIAGRFTNEPGNNYEYYAKKMSNKSRYEIFNRYIANSEVAEIIENSDIVVLPYTSASQSGVLALAFGFGKPVVATDTGSIGEILEHGKTGLLVPPSDSVALADAISEILLNDELSIMMGERAATMACGPLNWEVIGKQTCDIYRRLMSNDATVKSRSY
jgi:alpha-maltose-1-phosphate synthase